MSSLATQRNIDGSQVAYSYCLAHLAHLSERSAIKLKKRFPTYQSWLDAAPSEREEATKALSGNPSFPVTTTNFDELMDRAFSDLKNHEDEGIQVLSIDSTGYPELLKQIPDPPLVLFIKGSITALSSNLNVAVVGTRNATPAGERVAFKVSKWLGDERWCVVSGLAKGIDAAAHQGTLESRSSTAAVMATPLNKIYPAENRKLAADILDRGGCWISELPLWKKPHRSSFVQRDRIQSGLCVAVIPVQTDLDGGTMHTVRYAEQQHRLVLCPRPIQGEQFLRQYAGIRSLIETQRAIPFSGDEYSDVLQFLKTRREELLAGRRGSNGHEDPGASPRSPQTLSEQHKEVPVERLSGSTKRRGRSRLQVGFEFATELEAEKRHNTRIRTEKALEIHFLERLLEEISNAKHPDGTSVSEKWDVQVWLENKIKALRGGR